MKPVIEGSAKIYVPERSTFRGSEVFYNPEMAYARDITIGILNIFKSLYGGHITMLDSMAATGIRGIRVLKEVENVEKVVFNDINPRAVELMRKNLSVNEIDERRYEILNKDANIVFLERRKEFNYVDIDPIGSPARYLPNVYACLKNNSILAVTATDTAALYGKYPETCARRYGVHSVKTDFSKELGVRILITAIVRELMKNDMCFLPIYTHANHYFRVIGIVQKGVKKADECLMNLKHVSYCKNCRNRKIGIQKICDVCGKKMVILEPLWAGKIVDTEFITLLVDNMKNSGVDLRELIIARNEIETMFYYDVHEIASMASLTTKPMHRIISMLVSKGFYASRTHLCATGIKTNAGIKTLLDILKE